MRTQSILRRLGTLALAMVMTLSLVTMPALAEENPDTGDTLVEASAPVTTGGETPVETTQATEAPVETTQATEAPVETTQATEAPVETTQATEAPTENPEPTETTEAPTEAPTETTEAPTETTEVTEPTETTEVTEPTETTEDPAAAESAKRVAEVQAMIDALPDQIQSDEVAQYQEKVAAIRAILATMTAEQVAQLTGLEKLELELPTVYAVENPVAKIGETPYANSKDAFNAFNAMTGDVTVSILTEMVFTDGMELEGSYDSITFVGVGENAKITINQKAGGDYLESNKNVSFENLTLDKNNPSWANNSGHMGNYFSIQGGTVSYDNCKFPNGACTSSGTATYKNNCEFSHTKGEYGLWVYDDAYVTVQNGTFNSAKGIKLYAEDESTVTSTLKVEATTFTNNVTKKPAVAIAYAASVELVGNTYENPKGMLELNSGSDANCNGIKFVNNDSAKITAIDNNGVECGVVMNGKLYLNVTKAAEAAAKDAEPNSKVAVLYDPAGKEEAEFPAGTELTFPEGVKKPDNIVVKPSIAQVGDKHYATVQEAVKAAAESGGEVVIGSDVALSDSLIIPYGKAVTLNLNGFTLSDAEGALVSGGPDSVIVVNSGASLTVTGNGTIRSSLNGIKMTQKDGYDGSQTASLVVESGTVEAKSAAIIGNGNRHGTSITINGGTLKGDGGAIYHPQQGKVVINGGTLTGGNFGVEMRAGELTVNGGTITATAKDFNIGANGNGSTTQGVAVAVVPYSADRPVTVTINNGKLEGQHALHQEILKDNTGDVTLAVTGGTFTGEVVAKDEEKFISGGKFSKAPDEKLAIEDYSVTQNPDGSFGVKEDPFIEDEDGKHHVDPSKPLVLDELLEKNKEKDTVSLTISADAQVNKDHVLSGTLLLQADGHRITGSGSIRTGKKLELKDFGSLKTRVTLPEGGKLVFKDGRVQVQPSERTNDDHEGVGYSVPVIITVGDSTYTYFLSMDPDNAGKIVLDETGKPLVLGQYYSSKGDDAKAPEFTFVYISSHGTYYLGRHTDMTFVSNAPIPSMDYITIDGDPVEGKYLTEPDDEDTASVTLSYRFLRNLDTGKHTIRMYFKDGSRAKAEFSVRKTSVYDPENPKTGDTIFLPLAVMTLSAAALAVLMPRKKKYL